MKSVPKTATDRPTLEKDILSMEKGMEQEMMIPGYPTETRSVQALR